MKILMTIVVVAVALTVGCIGMSASDKAKLDRCAQLADSIELNGSRLLVTNGVLCVELPY